MNTRFCSIWRRVSVVQSQLRGGFVYVARASCTPRFSSMESFFVVKDVGNHSKRTFGQDESLPSLPVPKLEDTASKYLDSCRAVLSDGEYQRTKDIVGKFLVNEGPRLHQQLVEKSKKERNWLDKWWLDGYLQFRGSSGFLNFSGLPCLMHAHHNGDQRKSAALYLHFFMKFWLLLREEKLSPQNDSRGKPFSMYQFRHLFNVCRIPRPQKDELLNSFKTVYEGHCPSHIIIFYRQRMFKIPGVCSQTGELCTPSQFHEMINEIVKQTEKGPGIALLSELDRDSWCDARSQLIKLSPENEKSIHEIDTAVLCLSLGEESFESDTEFLSYTVGGSYGQRWADKFNCLVEKNGQFSIHSDHTPVDGMVVVTLLSYFDALFHGMKENGVDKYWGEEATSVEKPKELMFIVDGGVKGFIEKGRQVARTIESATDCKVFVFEKFGRAELRKLGRIHPCAFVEICMQLAYMRKHGKPASTYETSTTRTFYRGRTETLRTCTPEAVAFCRAVINGQAHMEKFFIEACKKYSWLMEECKAGRGCDRHLLGLASIASENGEVLPDLFKDEAYTKSGANGNFVLSTSFVGYSVAIGGVFPMREDGYGTFFRINKNSIYFALTAFQQCPETCAESFSEYLNKALIDVHNIMIPESRL